MAEDTVTFEGKTYALSKAAATKQQIIRGLSRVILETQKDILHYRDKALVSETALNAFHKAMREDHLTEDMLKQPEQQ